MVITFEITDASFHLGEILKVRFFRKKLRDLPAIQSNGDIVLLRNIQVNSNQIFYLWLDAKIRTGEELERRTCGLVKHQFELGVDPFWFSTPK